MRKAKPGRRGPSKSPLATRGQFSSSSSSVSSEAGPSRTVFERSSTLVAHNGGNPALALTFGDEPTHTSSPSDITRPIMVYSAKENQLIEINAVCAHDLKENWISRALADHLDLSPSPDPEDRQKWGHLGLKTFEFQGTVELQWTKKGSLKTKTVECRVVSTDSYILYLKNGLLSSAFSLQRTNSQKPPELEPTILPISPKETSISMASPSPAVGAFDGLGKVIEDDAEEALSADLWIRELEMSVHKYIEKPGKYFRKKPAVKIAVLDTGIDPEHAFINGAMKAKRIVVAESFVNGDRSIDDRFGHGTHVANLLLSVAPDTELYVAKVANSEEIPPDHNINKAILWAVDLNVDIITMSFGLGKDQRDIQEAISIANSKSIIMFAAASNRGGNYDVTYPARYEEVICVFSTDGMGVGSRCNPTQMEDSSYHFATLGEGVKSAWLTTDILVDPAPERRMTGTSFATPIAAGVAACVLEFALMNDMSDGLYKMLRRRKGMQTVFAQHLVDERQKLHYLHPWKLFGKDRTKDRILTLITDSLEC